MMTNNERARYVHMPNRPSISAAAGIQFGSLNQPAANPEEKQGDVNSQINESAAQPAPTTESTILGNGTPSAQPQSYPASNPNIRAPAQRNFSGAPAGMGYVGNRPGGKMVRPSGSPQGMHTQAQAQMQMPAPYTMQHYMQGINPVAFVSTNF
jgi:hypothetical protein